MTKSRCCTNNKKINKKSGALIRLFTYGNAMAVSKIKRKPEAHIVRGYTQDIE